MYTGWFNIFDVNNEVPTEIFDELVNRVIYEIMKLKYVFGMKITKCRSEIII